MHPRVTRASAAGTAATRAPVVAGRPGAGEPPTGFARPASVDRIAGGAGKVAG